MISFIKKLLVFIYYWFWVLYKICLHKITGKTELERICLQNQATTSPAAVIAKIASSIQTSRQIPPGFKTALFQIGTTSDAEGLLTRLAHFKNIKTNTKYYPTHVKPTMLRCLNTWREVNKLQQNLEYTITQHYDEKNIEHEKLLMSLWKRLKPDIRLSARISNEWGEIGFQGDNPKTDFRGMGLLGLQQLVMFAELYPRQAQAMLLAYSVDNLKGLPFAITGINLTGDLITLLRSGALHTFLYTHGPYRSSVDQLYATFFERMFQKWQAANPPNIMSFHKIHTELLQEMTEELKTNSVVVIQKSKNRI